MELRCVDGVTKILRAELAGILPVISTSLNLVPKLLDHDFGHRTEGCTSVGGAYVPL